MSSRWEPLNLIYAKRAGRLKCTVDIKVDKKNFIILAK